MPRKAVDPSSARDGSRCAECGCRRRHQLSCLGFLSTGRPSHCRGDARSHVRPRSVSVRQAGGDPPRAVALFESRPHERRAGRTRFSGIEEIFTVSCNTDEARQEIARQALAAFHPLLLLNRTSSRSKVNTLQLQKLLRQYVGGELTLLGEIPEDPAVDRSVRTYLPVVEAAPNSPAAHAFSHVGEVLLPAHHNREDARSRLGPAG